MIGYTAAEARNKTDETVLSTEEARQGERTGVIYVLIASALGAILGLALVGYYIFS